MKKKSKIREMIDNWRKYSQLGCCQYDLDDLEEMIKEMIEDAVEEEKNKKE